MVPVFDSAGQRITWWVASQNWPRSLPLMFWNWVNTIRGFDHAPS